MLNPYLQFFQDPHPLSLTVGGTLPSYTLAYETWGRLNDDKSNAVLLFCGLSASSHAKSHSHDDQPGWWEGMIGEDLGIDSERFFVICTNHLGGCFGSTGPSSTNPHTGKPYGPDFPPILLQDLAKAANQLVRSLGIQQLYCVLGSSMGGMLAMEYAAQFADEAAHMIMISGSGRPGAQSIAFRYVQRQVILMDPAYHGGWYYDKPNRPIASVSVARQIGNLTYRSRQEFNSRFGRTRIGRGYTFEPDFQVEAYLQHMGDKLAQNFDPNSFLFLTKSMDLYSLGYHFPTFEDGVTRIKAKSMIIGVSTDMLFPPDEQESIHLILKKHGRDSRFEYLESPAGHDAFLVEVDFFKNAISRFLCG